MYPQLPQFVRIPPSSGSSSSSSGGPAAEVLPNNVYAAFTQQYLPDFSFRDREPCYLFETSRNDLEAGIYLSRLVGSYNAKPLYATVCCVSSVPPGCNVDVNTSEQVISQTTPTITVTGSGFTSAAVVTFTTLGAVGYISSVTPTTLVIAFTTFPSSGGALRLRVTVGACQDTAKVANVTPTVVAATCSQCTSVYTDYCIAIPGVTSPTPECPNCELLQSIHVTMVGDCIWRSSVIAVCPPLDPQNITAELGLLQQLDGSTIAYVKITSYATPTSFYNVQYSRTFAAGALNCSAPFVLDLVSIGSTRCIGWPTTLTVTPEPCCRIDVAFEDDNLSISSPTVSIIGNGFSLTPATNLVTFNLGAVGTVTASTATSLTVTFSTPPTVGALTAIVNAGSCNSGAAVQVATMTGAGTITRTNKGTLQSSSISPETVTASISVGAGTMLVVTVGDLGGGFLNVTFNGVAMTQAVASVIGETSTRIYYTHVLTTITADVSIDFTRGGAAHCIQVNGLTNFALDRVTSIQTNVSTVDPEIGATATTAVANEYVQSVFMVKDDLGSSSPIWVNSYLDSGQSFYVVIGANALGAYEGYRVLTATAAPNGKITDSIGKYAGATATFS